MVNTPHTSRLHPQIRINHRAQTTIKMRLPKKDHRKGLSDFATEMACFVWNDTFDADVHHSASE